MIISVAYAAETVAHHEESLLQSAEFWVGFTFCLVVVLLAKPLGKALSVALQKRSDDIENKINEAEQLLTQAQGVLEKYKKQCEKVDGEVSAIMKKTDDLVVRLEKDAKEKFDASLKKQEENSMKRLKAEKEEAVMQIRDAVVGLSVKTAQELLKQKVTPQQNRELMLKTIQEIPSFLKH